jgi:hypothetical protein
VAREGVSAPAISASSPAWMSRSDPTCLPNALSRARVLSCSRTSPGAIAAVVPTVVCAAGTSCFPRLPRAGPATGRVPSGARFGHRLPAIRLAQPATPSPSPTGPCADGTRETAVAWQTRTPCRSRTAPGPGSHVPRWCGDALRVPRQQRRRRPHHGEETPAAPRQETP